MSYYLRGRRNGGERGTANINTVLFPAAARGDLADMRTSPYQGKGKTTMEEPHMYWLHECQQSITDMLSDHALAISQPGSRRDVCTEYSKSKQSHGVNNEATSIHVYANPS